MESSGVGGTMEWKTLHEARTIESMKQEIGYMVKGGAQYPEKILLKFLNACFLLQINQPLDGD